MINVFSYLPLLLIIFPSSLYFVSDTDVAKQLALICFLFTLVFFILIKNRIALDAVFLLIIGYALYSMFNSIIKHYFFHNYIIIQDVFEISRIFFIGFSYSLGASISFKFYDQKWFSGVQYKIYAIFVFIICVGFLLKSNSFSWLLSFYSSKDHRFSGLMPGINYAWFTSIFLFLGFMVLIKKNIVLSLFSLLSAFMVIGLSASFTSLISALIFIFAFYILNYNKISFSAFVFKIPLFLFIIFALIFLLIYIMIDYKIGLSSKFKLISSLLDSFDLSTIPSFKRRLELWSYVLIEIEKFPLTGHGSNKLGLKYTDNSYLMTMYRYGIVGLLFEFSIYTSIIVKSFSSIKYDRFSSSFSIALLSAYLISCIPANSFYELRLPYVMFFVLGVLNSNILQNINYQMNKSLVKV